MKILETIEWIWLFIVFLSTLSVTGVLGIMIFYAVVSWFKGEGL